MAQKPPYFAGRGAADLRHRSRFAHRGCLLPTHGFPTAVPQRVLPRGLDVRPHLPRSAESQRLVVHAGSGTNCSRRAIRHEQLARQPRLAIHPKTGELFISIGECAALAAACYRIKHDKAEANPKPLAVTKRSLDFDRDRAKQFLIDCDSTDPRTRRLA